MAEKTPPVKDTPKPYRTRGEGGAVILHLLYPFEFAGQRFESITFKRPKARHLRGMTSKQSIDETLDFAARLSGQLPAVIDELEGEDCMLMLEVVGDFFSSGPKTGRKS